MKISRPDSCVLHGLVPEDPNDPASASSAVELSLPLTFSAMAHAVWRYFDGTAFLFEYKDQLVVTDESLWLTAAGNGKPGSPMGFPRWVGDSWEDLESWLVGVYCDLLEYGEIEKLS